MTRKKKVLLISAILVLVSIFGAAGILLAQPPTVNWGSSGQHVINLQTKLKQWGYYKGVVDGDYGAGTASAVKAFQRKNGLPADGVVGPGTWRALGFGGVNRPAAYKPSRGISARDDVTLLARAITAEAGAEPYLGQVAVGAVILNRVESPQFPNTMAGVIYQPGAFESVSNGIINRAPHQSALRAAQEAMNGFDPTYGCLFFWNPSKPVSKWIWSRSITTRIGKHVFAR